MHKPLPSEDKSERVFTIDHNPFEGYRIQTTVQTSEGQKEIWLSCKLGGTDANLAYNQSFTLKLEGRIDKGSLTLAMETLVARHEALRSSISSDGEYLIIYENFPIEIDEILLSSVDCDKIKPSLSELIEEEVLTPLNLVTGPLLKCTLVRVRTDLCYLLLTVHHIVADGWSVGIILEELGHLYSCFTSNRRSTLSDPPRISEYIRDEIAYKKSSGHKETEQYWLDLYGDSVPTINIQTAFPRPNLRRYNSKRIDLEIPNSLFYDLRGIASKNGCSVATLLIAAFEVFLYKITYQNETIVGLPVAGQPSSGCPGLVGHCANLLPLKSTIDASSSFCSYMKKRKAEILDAYDHQRFTFGELIKKLSISRDPSRPTLIPIVLNIDLNFAENISFLGLKHQVATNPRAFENFEIFLNVNHTKDKTILEWAYHASLFSAERIHGYHTELSRILEAVASSPSIILDEILFENRLPYLEQPVEQSFLELLYSSFEQYAGNTAISIGNRRIGYDELNTKSNQVARMLMKNGIRVGHSVGIVANRSLETVIGLLGILKAGAVYVPIEPSLPIERAAYILKDSDAKVLLTYVGYKTEYAKNIPRIDIQELLKLSRKEPATRPNIDHQDAFAIYILYTSGSTGNPKGVKMGQEALTNLLLWQREHSLANSEWKTAQFSSLNFDVSFQEIFSTIASGGQLIIVPNSIRTAPDAFLDFIGTNKINRIFMPFVALQSMAETAVSQGVFPKSLTEVITAGEQLKVTHHIRTLFSNLSGSILYNQYGPTESHVVTELKLEGDPTNWPSIPTIGKEIYNTRIIILNERLQEVRPGEVGEICITGACLAEGYVNLDVINETRFLTIVTEAGENLRVYKTGDMGRRLPDHNIEFLGRQDQQVKIRGFRVELGEIEARLIYLDDVKDAVVIAHGEDSGTLALVAYIVQESSKKNFNPSKLKDELARFLPEYMVPQHIILLTEIPLTSTGKADRLKLPKPILRDHNLADGVDEVSTSTEAAISKIWAQFLKIDNISKKSNFFELGGHSIIAVRVMLAIEKEFGMKLPISTLFETPTIEKLAEAIEKGKQEPRWQTLVPISTKGTKHPIYLIHGGGYNVLTFGPLSNYMDAQQPIYALQGLGLYDKSKLLTSIEEIAAYYISEILENDPHGPYALGGYSSGGILAYEMARQLLEIGKEVSLLALLDTGTDICKVDSTALSDEIKKISYLIKKAAFYVVSLLKRPRETIRYLKTKVVKSRESEDLIEINNRYKRAFAKYRIQPLDIKIVLFRAKDRIYYAKDPEYYGWNKFGLQGIDVYEVEGEHNTFILNPYAKGFSERFQAVLNNANSKG